MKYAPLVVLLVALLAAVVALPGEAHAVERNFAGSAQIDYHFVPTARGANARATAFDGFTLEAALKLAVDFSDRLSANVKICAGCHGFETDMAYFDYRVSDELNFRLGRFSPSFGNFNIRHDPANHRLSDKPLPYDMGRMVRMRAWNMGVLPSPFPDNGLEVNGKVKLDEAAVLEYAAYAVSGFKGGATSVDLDFTQSRDGSLYYVDNNGRPTVGGRAALTMRLAPTTHATAGLSGMHGTFDPNNQLDYTILGADLAVRIVRTNLRLEYLVRRQDIDVRDPTRFKYDVLSNGDFFAKHGAYVELEQPVSESVDLILRADGMYRQGNVLLRDPGTPLPADGELGRRASVFRYTVGGAFTVERGLMLKASSELWQFNDKEASGQELALGFHLSAVGMF